MFLKTPVRRALTAVVGMAAAVAVTAIPASAKSAGIIPMPCTGTTAGGMVYAKQGADFRLGLSFGGPGAELGRWHATIIDNGTTVLMDDTMPYAVPNLQILTFASLAKGTHSLVFTGVDIDNGETCTGTIVAKV
jgi:hypothetical protein